MRLTRARRLRDGAVLISGESGTGKTTLIERLIPRLQRKGLRVGTIKHAHHGFDMDYRGKDSWRHAKAGANPVVVISPKRTAWLQATTRELSWRSAAAAMAAVDLVLVEGFKRSPGPRMMLDPGLGARLLIADTRCGIGVDPRRLTTREWETVAAFCSRWVRSRRKIKLRA